MRTLTEREKRFIDEFLVDLNGAAAVRRAGYTASNSKQHAWYILKRPRIQAAIEAALAERSERTAVSADRVVKELGRIAFADLRNAVEWRAGAGKGEIALKDSGALDQDMASAIAEVSQTAQGIKLKLHDKQQALTALGRHLGIFNDKLEAGAADDLAARLMQARLRGARSRAKKDEG